MSDLIPGSLYPFSNLARDSKNCVLFTDKVCMTRRNRSIMHSRLVRSKKQLRWDVFMTILINAQHEPQRCNALRYELIMELMPIQNLGHVRLGTIRNKNNWNNASKRLFGSYSHSGIPGFPFQLFCSQERNSRNIFRNIFLFRNIPNERALSMFGIYSAAMNVAGTFFCSNDL